MQVPTLQLMYQLWSTKGAKLSSERVNGHDHQQSLVDMKFRRGACIHLIENFKQVKSAQDE